MTTTKTHIAVYTSQRYLISQECAEQAVEVYLVQLERLDGRVIDRDNIEMDDDHFLREVIDAAAHTGDLYV